MVLISLTNLRADHLGVYGYSRKTSPNIDRLAAKSLVFQNAFSHASWTLPVAISLFTSQYPFTHGMMDRKDCGPLPGKVVTLIDILKQHGYATAAFVGDRDYSQKFGHTSRFHEVHDYVNENSLSDWKKYGVLRSTVPEALVWLRKNKDQKFFVLIQGYDTHCPFAIPEKNDMFDPGYRGDVDFTKSYWTFRKTSPVKMKSAGGGRQEVFLLKSQPEDGEEYEVMFYPEDVKHMIALYDGEIYNSDRYVGQVLDEIAKLGLDKKTLIVFFSEHGDMFGKHGRFMRGGPLRGTFYDDVLHVPLIIYHPRLAARKIDGLVQVIDMAPTLLDLLGLPKPAGFRGKGLRPLVVDNTAVNEAVFAGSAFTPKDRGLFFRHSTIIVSVRTKQWKLIFEKLFYEDKTEDCYELYDLRKDPEELQDVAAENPAVLREMRGRVYRWLGEIDARDILAELKKGTGQ